MRKFFAIRIAGLFLGLLISSAVFAQVPLTTKPNVSNLLAQCLANVPVVGNGAAASPICHASGALGSAAFVSTGTSGATIGLLNAANTWSAAQAFAAITATTFNGLTITTSTGTFTLASGKTLIVNNTMTFSATDGALVGFGAGGTVLYSGSAAGGDLAGTYPNPTLSAARKTLPTTQVFLTGSGTYTTPANVLRIRIRAIGGGGGGQGSGSASRGAGGTGGATTFGTALLTANGGTGGSDAVSSAGGTTTGGTINITGGSAIGSYTAIGASPGIYGAAGAFGGAGPAGVVGGAGGAGVANTGAGGGGGGVGSAVNVGAGGGAGGYGELFINSPAATYSYAVGAGGTAGTAGTSGLAGGAGGSGIIIVEEYYGS